SRVQRVFVAVRTTGQASAVLAELCQRLAPGGSLACHLITTLEIGFADGLEGYAATPLRMLEQPVSGGEQGALAGSLTMGSAGPLIQEDERLLADVAEHLVRFDDYGQPTRAKLLNNVTGA